MTTVSSEKDFVLGLDLGAGSVGWALIERTNGVPSSLIRAGCRVFSPAVEGNIETGREESRNAARRRARLQRRQTWRRSRRNRRVFRLLQGWGLLPAGPSKLPQERHALLDQLDLEILRSEWFAQRKKDSSIPEPDQVLPYLLRAAALDEALAPHALGRALYHLGQRRGFLSNRKISRRGKDEDSGKVKPAIAELRKQLEASGSRTLGEYFSHQSPSKARIRARWTARDMYEKEFNAIWDAQRAHCPALLIPERRKLLHSAIFYQRPLKSARGLIGFCELEPKYHRASRCLLLSQRFRLLDKVNNLQLLPHRQPTRPLTSGERSKLVLALEEQGDLTFAAMRRLLALPKDAKFNLEAAGETRVPGNRTNAYFLKVFGDKWKEMSPAERDFVVDYVRSFQRLDKLPVAASRKFGLSMEAARQLEDNPLEPDYFSLSKTAMEKVLPLLEAGRPYAEVRRELYPEKFQAREPLPVLPPVLFAEGAIGRVRNPAVLRTLTEMRKVVNAVVRRFGKPAEIRIELTRDLRNSRVQRERMTQFNRDNEKARQASAKRILAEVGDPKPSRRDLLKAQLWDECHGECPYTGKPIPFSALFGPEPQFDLEHIIPFSRSLDDSFSNLTLCQVEHNRNVKRNRAPSEVYGADPEAYQVILDRVRKFSSRAAHKKLERFLMTPDEIRDFVSGFTESQLNDTRYASLLAADYVGLLYGGRVDAGHNRRVRTTTGQLTAILRGEWKLNSILNDGPTARGGEIPKSRDDHRHHAIDAIAAALTDDGTIQVLSRAAEGAQLAHRRRFAPIEEPWKDFFGDVRDQISRMLVSHRVSGRVRGPLHEETLYSRPIPSNYKTVAGKKSTKPPFEYRVRKPLSAMTPEEAANIADPAIRSLVAAKLAEFGNAKPQTVFSVESNLPAFCSRTGQLIPIKKARVRKALSAQPLGSPSHPRFAVPESNHHAEIFAELDEKGQEAAWDMAVVPLAEAVRRKRMLLPIVNRDHGPHTSFKFALSEGEAIEIDVERKARQVFVVRAISYPQISLASIFDARLKTEMVKARTYFKIMPNPLRLRNPRKLSVSPLGDAEDSNE